MTASYEYFGLPGRKAWTDSLPKVVHVQADQETGVTLNLTPAPVKRPVAKPDGADYNAVYDAAISVSLTDESGNGYWNAQVLHDGTLSWRHTHRPLPVDDGNHSSYDLYGCPALYVDIVEDKNPKTLRFS